MVHLARDNSPLPHIVEFRWDEPVHVGAARIISGYHDGSTITAPLSAFTLQFHNGREWENVLDQVEENTQPAWAAVFPPIQTRRLRLVITKTHQDISRIWEVELYRPVTESQ